VTNTTLPVSIVDAHVHLWDPGQERIPWLAGNALLNRRYDVTTYQEHTASTVIGRMVYVQVDVVPADAFREMDWVLAQAAEDPRLGAIVAWAPLEDGDGVRAHLRNLRALDPRVVGVRRNIQSEPDPAFCLRPGFVQGVHLLAEYGLSCDLCLTHHQLPSAIALARQCPETTFILDHLGKPAIAAGRLDPWREHLAALAALPNAACKVSGVVTEANHGQWTIDDLAPYVAHALAVFGEDRVLFGGDWPVVLLASSYQRWVETLHELTTHLSVDARRRLWADNARRLYRLPNEENSKDIVASRRP